MTGHHEECSVDWLNHLDCGDSSGTPPPQGLSLMSMLRLEWNKCVGAPVSHTSDSFIFPHVLTASLDS